MSAPDTPTPLSDRPLSREEVLTLKVAHLLLERGLVESAARSLLAGARKASTAQCLVLAADLRELERRLNEQSDISLTDDREPT